MQPDEMGALPLLKALQLLADHHWHLHSIPPPHRDGHRWKEAYRDIQMRTCPMKRTDLQWTELPTSPGNLKACRTPDDVVKHVQWLKLLRSGCAMMMSWVGVWSTRVSLSLCQIRNGPVASRTDGRLSSVLVSMFLCIDPVAMNVPERFHHFCGRKAPALNRLTLLRVLRSKDLVISVHVGINRIPILFWYTSSCSKL